MRTVAQTPFWHALHVAKTSVEIQPWFAATCALATTTVNDVLSRKQCGHFIAKVAMDPRDEIVRIDRELDVLLGLPEAEATRRIAQAYQIVVDKQAFVVALIARLLVQRASGRNRDE